MIIALVFASLATGLLAAGAALTSGLGLLIAIAAYMVGSCAGAGSAVFLAWLFDTDDRLVQAGSVDHAFRIYAATRNS